MTRRPIPDTGLYVWSHGSLRLVARTGTVIPGVGTIAHLVMNVLVVRTVPVFVPNSGAHNNDRGQVVFGATLSKRMKPWNNAGCCSLPHRSRISETTSATPGVGADWPSIGFSP